MCSGTRSSGSTKNSVARVEIRAPSACEKDPPFLTAGISKRMLLKPSSPANMRYGSMKNSPERWFRRSMAGHESLALAYETAIP